MADPHADRERLHERLDELGRRLDRIERHLGLPRGPKAARREQPGREASPEASTPPPQHTQVDDTGAEPAPAAREETESTDHPQPVESPPATAASGQAREQPAGHLESTPLVAHHDPHDDAAPVTSSNADGDAASAGHRENWLESFLGIRAAAVVGAIAVLVGTGFLIREYATGFWAALPTWAQAGAIALFGAAMIGAGDIAHRRIGRAASVGLIGAGLSVLYLDAYATFQWFEPAVVGAGGSFVLMAIVALGGFALTVRTRSLIIGVLSLVGGYLTPILLAGADANLLGLVVYLTMMLAVALGLSAARQEPFRRLRGLAVSGLAVLGTMAVVTAESGEWRMLIVFLSLWWAMVMAEAVLAAMRGQSAAPNVLISLMSTSGYLALSALALAVIGPLDRAALGLHVIMVAGLSMATAAQFGPGLDGLRGRLTTAMDKLAAALWATGGVLIAAAIAFQFEGYGMSVGWLALSLASVELGRRLPARGVSVFALIVGALATARIVLIDSGLAALQGALVETSWILVNGWSLLALALIACLLIASWRVREHGRVFWPTVAPTLAALATAGWLGLTTLQMSGWAITTAWLAGVACLLACAAAAIRQRFAEIGLLAMIAVAARWLIVDGPGGYATAGGDASDLTPLFNVSTALAAAIMLVGAWAVRVVAQRDADATSQGWRAQLTSFAACSGAVFAMIVLSLETYRWLAGRGVEAVVWPFEQWIALWWTGLWAVGGAVTVLIGRRVASVALLVTGCVLLLFASIGWLAYPSLGARLAEGPIDTTVLLNGQAICGAVIAVCLMVSAALVRRMLRSGSDDAMAARMPAEIGAFTVPTAYALVAMIGFCIGTLEIDRAFIAHEMARQVGWSVFWSLYGVGLVAAGFRIPAAAARYVGLALLAVTIGKVMVIDLSQVDQLWRVVSFIVCGLLLIATSILYARLAPTVLSAAAHVAHTDAEAAGDE